MIVRLADWRAMRRAREIADALSSDPLVRAQARVRALRAIAYAEQRALSPAPAPVLWMDTRMYEARLRARVDTRKRRRGDTD